MSHSVRRALVDWLQRIVDHLSQDLVEDLGGRQVHANARYHVRDRLVPAVENAGGHGNVDVPVEVPQLGEKVDELARPSIITDGPCLGSDLNRSSGFNNNLVLGHQQGSSINLKNMATLQQQSSPGIKYQDEMLALQAGYLGSLSRKESSGGDK